MGEAFSRNIFYFLFVSDWRQVVFLFGFFCGLFCSRDWNSNPVCDEPAGLLKVSFLMFLLGADVFLVVIKIKRLTEFPFTLTNDEKCVVVLVFVVVSLVVTSLSSGPSFLGGLDSKYGIPQHVLNTKGKWQVAVLLSVL